MILKKPYAFLIKKFKIIHFILAGLVGFSLFRFYNLLNYFNDYINNTASRVLASEYISIFIFLVILLIIIGSFVVYLLMRFKKKPKLLYLTSIIGFFVCFIILWYTLTVLKNLEFDYLDTRVIRITRDLLSIATYFQGAMIIAFLIRAFGFDIKKFNFGKDIEELNIDVSDNEEFELVMGLDTNKIARKTRRKGREFKYFVLENKFIFSFLLVIVIMIITFVIFLNVKVINKIYKENDNVQTTIYSIKITDSYYTTLDKEGNVIKTDDKVFVVLKLNIKGKYESSILNKNNLRLVINGVKYFPNLKHYNSFSDIGIGYNKQKILKDASNYILVYEVLRKDIDKEMIFTFVDQINYTNAGIEAKYKKVKLSPTSLDTSSLADATVMPNELDFSASILDNGTLKINSYKISSRFLYQNSYIYATSNSFKKLGIMRLDVNYQGSSNFFNILSNFGKLYYMKDGVKYNYQLPFVNKTPLDNNLNEIYIEVYEEIAYADVIWLEFNIRDKKYNYILKQKD